MKKSEFNNLVTRHIADANGLVQNTIKAITYSFQDRTEFKNVLVGEFKNLFIDDSPHFLSSNSITVQSDEITSSNLFSNPIKIKDIMFP